nr:CPBP family glutamic-type intramembrane protease [Ramlibacter aurantiacus]
MYGGITEEVMLRWGLLSALACGLHRVFGRNGQRPGLAWIANAITAVLFALGHLPALLALGEPTPVLLARVLVLNTVAGLAYGWLFWRGQLESAMTAHAATHVGFWVLGGLAG